MMNCILESALLACDQRYYGVIFGVRHAGIYIQEGIYHQPMVTQDDATQSIKPPSRFVLLGNRPGTYVVVYPCRGVPYDPTIVAISRSSATH